MKRYIYLLILLLSFSSVRAVGFDTPAVIGLVVGVIFLISFMTAKRRHASHPSRAGKKHRGVKVSLLRRALNLLRKIRGGSKKTDEEVKAIGEFNPTSQDKEEIRETAETVDEAEAIKRELADAASAEQQNQPERAKAILGNTANLVSDVQRVVKRVKWQLRKRKRADHNVETIGKDVKTRFDDLKKHYAKLLKKTGQDVQAFSKFVEEEKPGLKHKAEELVGLQEQLQNIIERNSDCLFNLIERAKALDNAVSSPEDEVEKIERELETIGKEAKDLDEKINKAEKVMEKDQEKARSELSEDVRETEDLKKREEDALNIEEKLVRDDTQRVEGIQSLEQLEVLIKKRENDANTLASTILKTINYYSQNNTAK